MNADLLAATPSARDADPREAAIVEVECRLAALILSLHEPGGRGVETAAAELQSSLATALDRFNRSRAPISMALRQRIARMNTQVALHRDTLARATAALGRAIDVMLSRDSAVYNERGAAAHDRHRGVIKA